MKTFNFKLFCSVFIATFMMSYVLGVLRWQWESASIIYGVLNLPFGMLFILAEKYLWTGLGPSHLINDEIISTLIWGASILLQSAVYYYVIIKIRQYKEKKTAFTY